MSVNEQVAFFVTQNFTYTLKWSRVVEGGLENGADRVFFGANGYCKRTERTISYDFICVGSEVAPKAFNQIGIDYWKLSWL